MAQRSLDVCRWTPFTPIVKEPMRPVHTNIQFSRQPTRCMQQILGSRSLRESSWSAEGRWKVTEVTGRLGMAGRKRSHMTT
jgi:hypothetical protein